MKFLILFTNIKNIFLKKQKREKSRHSFHTLKTSVSDTVNRYPALRQAELAWQRLVRACTTSALLPFLSANDVGCFLHAVNMCFSHWLMSKAVSASGQAEYSQAENQNRDMERKKAESK